MGIFGGSEKSRKLLGRYGSFVVYRVSDRNGDEMEIVSADGTWKQVIGGSTLQYMLLSEVIADGGVDYMETFIHILYIMSTSVLDHEFVDGFMELWTEIANTIIKLAQVVGNLTIGGKTGKLIREYTEKRMSETPPRNSTTVTQHYDPEMQFKGVDKTVTTKW